MHILYVLSDLITLIHAIHPESVCFVLVTHVNNNNRFSDTKAAWLSVPSQSALVVLSLVLSNYGLKLVRMTWELTFT